MFAPARLPDWTLKTDGLPNSEVLGYICLTDFLVVYSAVARVFSSVCVLESGVARYYVVSSQMKTDVVLLACQKLPE